MKRQTVKVIVPEAVMSGVYDIVCSLKNIRDGIVSDDDARLAEFLNEALVYAGNPQAYTFEWLGGTRGKTMVSLIYWSP